MNINSGLYLIGSRITSVDFNLPHMVKKSPRGKRHWGGILLGTLDAPCNLQRPQCHICWGVVQCNAMQQIAESQSIFFYCLHCIALQCAEHKH